MRELSIDDNLRIEYSVDAKSDELIAFVFYNHVLIQRSVYDTSFGGYVRTFDLPVTMAMKVRVLECSDENYKE